MPKESPDLLFGPGPNTGFTPAGVAGFSDLRPPAVVREFIQNSLDAVAESNEKTAVVRFRLTRGKTRDIPGIRSYRKAFEAAIQRHKKDGVLPSQAQIVVDTIQRALDQDEHDILSILDNGVGLNESRMNALLSDGVSDKAGTATGTYGNGHSVAIPASNFRYVLYGGVIANGHRIGAGHAVLASHTAPGKKDIHPKAGDGFLIHGFKSSSQDDLYDYARSSSIPDLITSELRQIRRTSKHGAAVIIPGFNNFRENNHTLWEHVARAAACNFFQAIEDKRLIVKVEDLRPEKTHDLEVLDRTTLPGILRTYQDETRSRSFLGGQKAFDAHNVLKSGKRHTVPTSQGKIRIQLLIGTSGSTRVDLCRNGMWITHDKNIPGFYYKFQDRRPFHALLLLDSSTGGSLHELVRNAEGPLHDKLDIKSLPEPDKKDLRNALIEIRDWLRSQVPEISGDSYSPDDFLALDFGDDAAGGKARPSFWGTPTAVLRRDPGPRDVTSSDPHPTPDPPGPPGPVPPNPPPPRPSPVLRPLFQAASIPSGANRRRIHLECQDSCKNAEFRMCVDENVDATCDRPRRDEITPVFLSSVKVNDQNVRDDKLVRENGKIVGVLLGNLAADTSVRIDAKYELPEDFSILAGEEPALRVEVFKAPSAATGGVK